MAEAYRDTSLEMGPGAVAPRRLSVVMVAACPFPQRRGTPARVQRLAEALVRRGVAVRVVSYALGDEEEELPFAVHRAPRVATYDRLAPGPTWQKVLVVDPLLARTLRRVVTEHPVDLIHAHHAEGLLVALAGRGRTRAPLLFDVHTLLASELPYYGLGLPRYAKRALGARLDRWLPRHADHVVAVSDRIARALVESSHVPAWRVDVVPSGIEEEWFRAPAGNETTARRPLVVFAGNLAPYQGVDLLLHAFRRVAAARADARLRIVSDSSFASHYATARRLGILERIELVRAGLDRLPQLLAEARLAVNPRADGEGAAQKVLNYMAVGLPTVCFARGAAPLRHLETAWVAADGDLGAFAAGMLRLLEDPDLAARLGAAARALARSQLGWDAAAQRALAVYARLLATGGREPAGAASSERR